MFRVTLSKQIPFFVRFQFDGALLDAFVGVQAPEILVRGIRTSDHWQGLKLLA
jgi:hypothetical protein